MSDVTAALVCRDVCVCVNRCEEPERREWNPCVPGRGSRVVRESLGRDSSDRRKPINEAARYSGRVDAHECRRA